MTSIIDRVLGRCHIESLIGEGSSALVYKGYHQTLGVPVAVKVLRTNPQTIPSAEISSFQERFRREAKLAARLNHEGIVRVIDFGEEMGLLYLVMEYVNGSSLLDYMRRESPLNERLSLKIIAYLASALHVAHAQNIIHRDLKPSNILVTKSGQLKISDLGLAKDLGQMDITMANSALGTPTYMAPECFSAGKAAGPESDIYSLGIILYEMLMGLPPFTGSLNQVLTGHMQGELNFGSNHANPIRSPSPFVRDLLKSMLAKKPQDRIHSCLEVKKICKARVLELTENSLPQTNLKQTNYSNVRHDSSNFKKISQLLESRLGSKVSEYQGTTVTHTTLRERFLIWILLFLFLAGCIAAYIYLN
jgi:eukaryotic-like serine/threonine-protein kinase